MAIVTNIALTLSKQSYSWFLILWLRLEFDKSVNEHKARKHNIGFCPYNECGCQAKGFEDLDEPVNSTHITHLTMFYFRYARLYLAIQFFDSESLLPPPFTYLTLMMYLIRWGVNRRSSKLVREKAGGKSEAKCSPLDMEYRNLIFAFIDNVKPCPKKDKLKGK